MRKPIALGVPLAAAAMALSACTAEAGRTISADSIADAAADALEEQIGTRPDVDCGDDAVIPSEGKEVDCVLTDPETGDEYDTTVTFAGEDGGEWNFDVQVASEPR
ncbi:DUF4333 domain-containing protein [Glycomyces xiaoerkulensis]|uniref:DUF4333 domain-containing protein n=1 Tax=Glycomyces xiaoerkulensis TaxID=2038139 RepID=UPI000C258192|nr:DUF4333 domain-containing protein [Glycomyces xiaoerkulensis]